MKSVFRVTVVCIVLASLIVGYYYYLSHSLSSNEETASVDGVSELDRVLTQDFKANYPNSPREVVRWYNRIITLYYSESLSNDELEGLCDQAQRLMDPELVANNPRSEYINSVKADIRNYKERKRKIISSDAGSVADVKYKEVGGETLAYVTSYYLVTDGSDYNRSYQTYVMREDVDRKYKILGFQLTDEDGNVIE